MDIPATKDKKPKGEYFGVFVSIIIIFLLTPLVTDRFYAYFGLQTALVLLITSITYSLRSKRRVVGIGVFVICSFILLETWSLNTQSSLVMGVSYGLVALYLMLAIVLLLQSLIEAPVIDTNLVFGALTTYFLIGILWAKLYFVDTLFFPESFHGIGTASTQLLEIKSNFEIQFDLLYYSYTTLATLGIGDIYPIHHLSRSLTVLEAMFGQLFVAIVIAKVVSIWRKVD